MAVQQIAAERRERFVDETQETTDVVRVKWPLSRDGEFR